MEVVAMEAWERIWSEFVLLIRRYEAPRCGLLNIDLRDDIRGYTDAEEEEANARGDTLVFHGLYLPDPFIDWLEAVSSALQDLGHFYAGQSGAADRAHLREIYSKGISASDCAHALTTGKSPAIQLFHNYFLDDRAFVDAKIRRWFVSYANEVCLRVPDIDGAVCLLQCLRCETPYEFRPGSNFVPTDEQPSFLGTFLSLWSGATDQERGALLQHGRSALKKWEAAAAFVKNSEIYLRYGEPFDDAD